MFLGLLKENGEEVSAPEYERQFLKMDQVEPYLCESTENVSFPVSRSDWGTITKFGIFLYRIGGVPLFTGDFSVNLCVTEGITVQSGPQNIRVVGFDLTPFMPPESEPVLAPPKREWKSRYDYILEDEDE